MNSVEIRGPGLNRIREKLGGFSSKSHIFEGLIGKGEIPGASEVSAMLGGIMANKEHAEVMKALIPPDWYRHNVERYGTKWDVAYGDCTMTDTEEEIGLTFDTAWSPPASFCSILRDEYKVNVTCRYSEPGMDFAGETRYLAEGGCETEDYTYLEGIYHLNGDQFWDEMETKIESEIESMEDDANEQDVLDDFLEECEFLTGEESGRVRKMWEEKLKENE